MIRFALVCGFAALIGTAAQAAPTVNVDFGTGTETAFWNNPVAFYSLLTSSDTTISYTWAGFEVEGTATLQATELDPHATGPLEDPLGIWTLTNNGPDTLLGFSVLLPSTGVYRSGFDIDSDALSTGRAGMTFAYDASSPVLNGAVSVTYDLQQVGSPGGVADQWRKMSVDFTGLDGGGMAPGRLTFLQDVDTYFPPDPLPTPVPASVLLLVSSLAGMMLMGKRKRQDA